MTEHLIARQCAARCLRVAQRFSDVCTLWSSYQWANISAEPHAHKQRAVHCFFYEKKHLTHTKQGAVHFSPRPYAQYRWATRLQARWGTLPCNDDLNTYPELVTTQVVLDCEATCGPSVCGIYFNTNHTNLTNCAGVNLQLGNNSIRVSLTRIFRILLIERGNYPSGTMKW